MTQREVPAVEGWFALGAGEPTLLGGRCRACATIVFPNRARACPNPGCPGTEFDVVELSRRGRVWSFTTNHYPPPEPYVAPDPFVPYTVVAVELEAERMVVLGQLAEGAHPAALRVGGEVELTVGTLFERDGERHMVWKWRPVEAVGASLDGEAGDG